MGSNRSPLWDLLFTVIIIIVIGGPLWVYGDRKDFFSGILCGKYKGASVVGPRGVPAGITSLLQSIPTHRDVIT